MTIDDRDYMRDDPSPKSKTQRGSCAGLEWEIEDVADGPSDSKDTLIAGAIGYSVGFVLGFSPFGRMLAAAAGAVGSHVARRYRVSMDWSPDRYRADAQPDSAE